MTKTAIAAKPSKAQPADIRREIQENAFAYATVAELGMRELNEQHDPKKGYGVDVPPDLAVVLRVDGTDPESTPELLKHFGRIDAERELASQGGTPDDFAAAKAARDRAAKAEAEQGPSLQEQIDGLAKKMTALQTSKRDTEARVVRMETARKNLRGQLPPMANKFVEHRRHQARHQLEGEKLDKELAECDRMVDAFVDTACIGPDWVEHFLQSQCEQN